MQQKIHVIVVEVWESILCGVVAIILEKVMFMAVLARLPQFGGSPPEKIVTQRRSAPAKIARG